MPPPSGPPPPPSSVPARDSASNPSPASKPSVFQMPSSTPIPPLHPYNKPPSSGAGASASTPSSINSASNRPSSANTASNTRSGDDLRPSYFSSNLSKEERERSASRQGAARAGEVGRPSSATPTAHSHTHTATAPHHHHHHHHHHTHGAQASTAASTTPAAGGSKPAGGASRYEYTPPFPAYDAMKSKREQLDREEAQRREAERKGLPSIQTSPKASSTSIYSRTGMPPSPTDRRTLPPSSSAGPGSTASKPSISPQPAPATIGGTRPIPPISSYSSLSRALPSPFDSSRDRAGSQTTKTEPGHHRTLSSSGSRTTEPVTGSLSQASPPKSAASVPGSQRGGFGPPLFASSIQRSPVNRPAATVPPSDPARDAARPSSTSNTPSQASAKPQPTGYSGFSGSAPGFYNSSTYYRTGLGFGDRAERERTERERADKQRYEMDRLAEVEREREAKRKAGRNDAQTREEQIRVWDRGERERKEQERQSAQVGGFPALRFDPWTGKEKKAHPAPDGRAYKAEPPAAQYPPESTSAMQQVAPQREPRPYGYKAETPDHSYSSRDKRSRMDMAVEEQAHRRGSVSKAKKQRREEDRYKTPTFTTRELAKLVTPNISEPSISNQQIVVGRSDFIVGREVYEGSTWNLGKTATMRNNTEGMLVIQVSGKFLGAGWVVALDSGWKEGRNEPPAAIFAERRLWGTGTYTDDSDLVAVLAHDGWVRWSDVKSGQPTTASDDDFLQVKVLIVPPLIRYYASKRHRVTSRGWGNGHDGMSFSVQEVTPSIYEGKKDRKMRMAEAAKQRALVLDESSKANAEQAVLITNLGEKVEKEGDPSTLNMSGFAYASAAMLDILDVRAPRSLYDYDLHLHDGHETYVLHLGTYDTKVDPPKLQIELYPKRLDDGSDEMTAFSEIKNELRMEDLVWVDAGLMILARDGSKKGVLCRAQTFSWVRRETLSDVRAKEQSEALEID